MIAAMKQALEALKECNSYLGSPDLDEPIATLSQAIEQAEKQEPAPGYCKHCNQYTIEEPLPAPPQQEKQEPVGYFSVNDYGNWEQNESNHGEPFYAAPPQRQPLTLREIAETVLDHCYGFGVVTDDMIERAVRAIERKHGIGDEK